MISVDLFLSRLLPHVPACPEPLAQQAILDTAISFCEHTDVLREDLDLFYSIAGVSNYELDVPRNHQLTRILSVTVDGRKIDGLHEEQTSGLVAMSATPSAFFTRRQNSNLELVLYPKPDTRYDIVVHASLQPLRNTTQLADDLFNYWCQPIIDGALARITKVPNEAFTDFNASLMYQNRYADGVNSARIEGYHGRIRGGSRVKQRPLA